MKEKFITTRQPDEQLAVSQICGAQESDRIDQIKHRTGGKRGQVKCNYLNKKSNVMETYKKFLIAMLKQK